VCVCVCVCVCARARVCTAQEASMSWEKRQAAVRAKVQAEADAAVIWNTWFTDVAGACGVRCGRPCFCLCQRLAAALTPGAPSMALGA
jgi:hypothetical protein